MKKFIALIMACVMILSLADIVMAARPNAVTVNGDPAAKGIAIVGPFGYDSELNCMRDSGLCYGDTVYYLLVDSAGNPMCQYGAVDKLKIKTAFEEGEKIVDSVSIAKKYISIDADNHSALLNWVKTSGYCYFVAIKTVDHESTSDADVIGTFTFSRKSVDLGDAGSAKGDDPTGIEDKIDDVKLDFAFNIFYGDYDYLANPDDYIIVTDSVDLRWDRSYVLKFASDDTVDLTFGFGSANEGTFSVDVSGQSKVNLRYDTNADESIAAANPGAKMYFVNFNNVKFNRVGEFAYEMEDGAAAYRIVDGQLVEIPGCEYDESDETFYFKTRVLESYVFSTSELVNPVTETPSEEIPTADAVILNPSTGACPPAKGALFK